MRAGLVPEVFFARQSLRARQWITATVIPGLDD
jgi:hypothetical protein